MEARDLFLSADLSPEKARLFLSNNGFSDPESADRHFQEIAERVGSHERMGALAGALLHHLSRSADPDAALVHLYSFIEVIAGPLNLVSFLLQNEAALEVLIKVLGASPFLTQILRRNPEYFYWLLEKDRLRCRPGEDYFSIEAGIATSLSNPATALDALRRFRRRENLRIASQDLLRTADFRSTVQQISQLADSILQATYDVLARNHLQNNDGFAVLALGKLGGSELNFSSDVDLLYIFADERQPETMLKFARAYTRALTEFTGEGHLYRVDLRLRPMGARGEIAYSLRACRNYYENWADTLDRLALIKCRPVAGDLQLARRFLEPVQDFIYKKYLDVAAVEEVGWLKRRSDDQLSRRGQSTNNVKLGIGGIREVEFFVQAFQILYGGGQPEIRTPNTLRGLQRLVDAGLISLRDFQSLTDAYIFLREVEHRLQLVHDRQTQVLPTDPFEREKCARRMGYLEGIDTEAPLKSFDHELNRHTSTVRRVFDSLFRQTAQPGLSEITLNPALDRDSAVKILEGAGVTDPAAVYEGIQLLNAAPSFPQSPARMRNLLTNLLPVLLEPSHLSPQPAKLFSRLDRFSEALGGRAGLYTELIENAAFADRLLRVLSSGDFLAETLIRYPELLEAVTSPPSPPDITRELPLWPLEEPAPGEIESLRIFKRREEFKSAVKELSDPSYTRARRVLTRLAEACLRRTFAATHGDFEEIRQTPFVLLALGKLAGHELTYHSDLDLILLYEDSGPPSCHRHFSDLLREWRGKLEAYTEHGRCYKLDFRLRPEGRHSAMATPVSRFRTYLADRAEAWERLAYAKMRPLFGFGIELDWMQVIQERGFSEDEIQQLKHLRIRKERELGRESGGDHFDFKVGRGGLLDIQFVVQFQQIRSGLAETHLATAIEQLREAGKLERSEAAVLDRGLRFLHRLEALQRLLAEKSVTTLPCRSESNAFLASLLGLQSGEELLTSYQSVREEVRQIYERIFERSIEAGGDLA